MHSLRPLLRRPIGALVRPRLWGAATLALGLSFSPLGASDASVKRSVVAESIQTDHGAFRVVRTVSGLEHPWGVAWLPDGRMLVTERPGRLNLIDGERVVRLSGLPAIHTDEDQKTAPQGGNQGGLLDVVVHPDYAQNGWIYFTYSSPGDDDTVTDDSEVATATALARARLNEAADGLQDLQILYVQSPATNPGRHYGSRIVFPGDGTVVFSIGDRGLRRGSQNLQDPAGSFIRLREDGGAPEDNPFVGVPPGNLRPEIYSFGHRNNQGIAIHPETGEIWTTEHGPHGGDLLHRVERGANYGWPQVAFGVEYDTKQPIGIGRGAPGVREPVRVWQESKAPSGLAFHDGEGFPAWRGHLFAGFLLSEQLRRIELRDGEVVGEEVVLDGTVGRIRDVRQGPDGLIYVVTDHSEGGIYRLEPLGARGGGLARAD